MFVQEIWIYLVISMCRPPFNHRSLCHAATQNGERNSALCQVQPPSPLPLPLPTVSCSTGLLGHSSFPFGYQLSNMVHVFLWAEQRHFLQGKTEFMTVPLSLCKGRLWQAGTSWHWCSSRGKVQVNHATPSLPSFLLPSLFNQYHIPPVHQDS